MRGGRSRRRDCWPWLWRGCTLRNIWLARQAEKKAPPAVPPTIEQLSNEFSYSKVEGQRTIYTVKASRTTEFKEGSRNLLEDVAIVVYGKKGERNDTLRHQSVRFYFEHRENQLRRGSSNQPAGRRRAAGERQCHSGRDVRRDV